MSKGTGHGTSQVGTPKKLGWRSQMKNCFAAESCQVGEVDGRTVEEDSSFPLKLRLTVESCCIGNCVV